AATSQTPSQPKMRLRASRAANPTSTDSLPSTPLETSKPGSVPALSSEELRTAAPASSASTPCRWLNVASKQLRRALEAKLPRYPLPVALVGRLAVHQDAQGQGVGQRLLGDALRRVHAAAALAGCVGVIVDAKDEAAERFYERYGFTVIVSSDWPHRLFLPTGSIAAGLRT
ncbi:MAG: GNAT superfamily N-acetyltransferase, partial [Myxococcota bacterium]